MFPYKNPIDIGKWLRLDEELVLDAAEVIELLRGQISERRRERIDEVVSTRTCTVVPVMEGIHDFGNVAAVLRSAEGLGYQVAHLIDDQPKKKTSRRVTQGAHKWVEMFRWTDTLSCVNYLRDAGYSIVATDLDADITLEEVDFTRPTAMVFGNEMDGVSPEMLDAADQRCIIPIDGFVQSFNISVAAALSLYEAKRQRVERLGEQGDLDAVQRQILRAQFYLRAVNQPRRLVPELWRRRNEA